MTEEMDVKIRIFADTNGQYVDVINGVDNTVIIQTDIDERGLMVDIDQLRLALRKMVAK